MSGVKKVERVLDPTREAEKKRLYSSNRPGAKGDGKYYAIARGRISGVVIGWDRVEPHVVGCKKPVCYQAFGSEQEAWAWLAETKKKLQRMLKKTRTVTKTRPVKGKKDEEEEYQTDEDYISYEDTSEEDSGKGRAPKRAPPPPPPKKLDEANFNTGWMGSQRYTTDKVWLVEEEQPDVVQQEADVNLNGTPVAQNYTIGQVIGRGGQAIVKLGTHKQGGAKVALKGRNAQIAPDFNIETAKREIEVMKQIGPHPNVIAYKESFVLRDAVVIVLELADGGELLNSLVADINRPWTEADVQQLIGQLSNTIANIHAKDIVHRDLVPENLLLAGGKLKVAGFSLAKSCKGNEPFDGVVGAPCFQPPEVIQRQSFGKASDVWSIGVIAYLLCSGNVPFQDKNTMRLSMKIRKGEYDVSSPGWQQISPAAKDFIKQCLNVNPQARIPAANALGHPFLKAPVPKVPLANFRKTLKSNMDSGAWM